MSRLTRRFFCLAVLAVSISLLAACQKTTPSTPDLPDLKVGVVGVEQPKGTTDLLAGFIPEDRVLASDQAVATFNEELMKLLKTTTHRSYVFIPKAGALILANAMVRWPTGPRSGRTWAWICSSSRKSSTGVNGPGAARV